ncbi:WYL domain-containing transcriptional regulator [Thermosynechococcaceae cyanobacterium BACA0444]|uniref:WYL domain-containing transcriptional regulator n=1 Tax=Pseudocalidococcus azoricus BACA0444 TaxID=2918990 RepID=A0AAE4JVQ9_9CYAN|nr:WYL domain-containing transcriptional regulator [Pseudocalidococcus azoricus]MDS3860595.1 WYL domain-containing transcriptional regulator [Pseudocalidococcus azoricus BACA0444]
MSRHLERLLQLDALIRAKQRQTIGNLALSLEVSERTIRNDLAFLRDRFHAPLKFSRIQGFHYTDDTWRLPSVSLSKGELFALTVGARMLESYSGSVYAQNLRSAITRLSERLPEQAWVDLQTIADERIIFRSGAEINLNPDIWHSLEEACQAHRQVQMTYFTASRNCISERKFDPYLLYIYRGTNPYVIGYCHNRREIRWFRVDRIRALDLLETPFVIVPTFNAKDYLEMIFQHEAGGVPQPISIWFDCPTAPYIRERRWHPTQEIEEHPDGSLTLQMVVRGLNDLKRWVLFYGKGAIVREPPELMQMIRDEVAIMNTFYTGETNANY